MKSREEILNDIMLSKKYRAINQDVIFRIVNDEYGKYKNDKQLIKEIKSKLHQMHEIFLNSDSNKTAGSLLLEDKYDDILKLHMSSLERFSFYSEFYKQIFSVTGIPITIMDLACGYNPFSIKYMNLNSEFQYYAYDINEETSDILNDFFKKNHYSALSKTIDLSCEVPKEAVDVAMILKFLPLVERQNKLFSTFLLKNLNAKYIVVSFPTKTVTGKNIGMLDTYKRIFHKVIDKDFIILKEILFDNELVFIITKQTI